MCDPPFIFVTHQLHKSTNCEIGCDNGRQTTFKMVGKGKKKKKKRKKREAIMIASMLIWCGGMNIDDARNRQKVTRYSRARSDTYKTTIEKTLREYWCGTSQRPSEC